MKSPVNQTTLPQSIARVGRLALDFFGEAGTAAILLFRILAGGKNLWKDRKLFFEQALRQGVRSLPLVMLVGIFTGAVTTWQGNYQLRGYVPLQYLGVATLKAVVIELGPVLTALIIAGRVSASIAAELGTMRVTEQIDALESMGISPIRFLAVPRFFANLFMMPVLIILADFIAMMGASFVATALLGMTSAMFWNQIPTFFEVFDIVAGLIKALVVGAITALMGCHIGFTARGGAEGVGMATIRAFVWSCLLILVMDYALAMMLF
jgi:phospholipid/cholesterol/gamma-HCH transport system permease protein